MSAESSNQLVINLKTSLKSSNVSVEKFAVATGISADKVRKWFSRGVQKVDADEAKKIQSWLKGEYDESPKKAGTNNVTINSTVLKSLEDLSYSCRTNADSIKGLVENDRDKTRSIELLVKILAVNSGVLPKEVLAQLSDHKVPDAPSVEEYYKTDLSKQKAGKS